MKIRIYQIPVNQGTALTVFQDLSTVLNQYGGRVPAELYKRVYCGEVNAETLEDVFYIFNIQHPADYTARSLSVSDVVEIIKRDQHSFYYCCMLGFHKIHFDAVEVTK